jgi:hypothetical protein
MADDSNNDKDPPTLSDALAALVTSVSMARVQADISSAQVAQLYKRHDVLRLMPVPRIRLNRVHVSLPFVVTAVRRGRAGVLAEPVEIAKGLAERLKQALRKVNDLNGEVWYALTDKDSAIIPPKSVEWSLIWGVNQAVYHTQKAFELSLVSRPSATSPSLQQLLGTYEFVERFTAAIAGVFQCVRSQGGAEDSIDELAVPALLGEAVKRVLVHRVVRRRNEGHEIAKRTPASTPEELREPNEHFFSVIIGEKDPDKLPEHCKGTYAGELYVRLLAVMPELFDTLGAFAGLRAFKHPTVAPEVEISVHTADVKNQGNPGTITRLDMVMSEEGLEWVVETGEDGEKRWKLLPE